MNRMIHGIAGFLKHSLLLCLCAVLFCSAVCAETIIDLGLPEGGDGMGYGATLPDGRLVFSGCNSEAGNSMNSKARLLCLNPDGTTSWDYIYPQEGCCCFYDVNVLKDGTLGISAEDVFPESLKGYWCSSMGDDATPEKTDLENYYFE